MCDTTLSYVHSLLILIRIIIVLKKCTCVNIEERVHIPKREHASEREGEYAFVLQNYSIQFNLQMSQSMEAWRRLASKTRTE